MSTQIQAGGGAEASNAGGQASQAGAPAGGTPSSQTAEAGGQGGAPDAAKLQERVTYLETELKNTIAQRDQNKSKWSELPEVKQLRERAARADELEAADKKRAESEAVQRGEFQKLYEGTKAENESLKTQLEAAKAAGATAIADTERRFRAAIARGKLDSAYQLAGGFDLDTFGIHADKALAEGRVSVGDDGQVAGVEVVIKQLQDGKPHLFRAGSGATSIPGGVGAPTAGLDVRKLIPEGRRGSLADGPILTPEQRKGAYEQMGKAKP